MKKIIFILAIIAGFVSSAHSQNIRLNAYGSYVFDDAVNSYYSNTDYFDGTVKGGFLWGAGLEFRVHEYYGIELMYQRLDTKAPTTYYDNNSNQVKNADLDLGIDYIMVGGVRSVHPTAKVDPYGGLLLGMAIINASNPETKSDHSATKFAWGLRGGANIWASDRVGIKLQAQLVSVPQGAGGGVYFGTGGASAGVTTYSSILQFSLGGGLVFKLGHAQATKK